MSTQTEHIKIFQKYLPEPAVTYCYQLWQQYGFDFRITKSRSSRFGDYKYMNNRHKITVNGDMSTYAFLITYLHEVAHLITFQQYEHRVRPHGKEWKKAFQGLAKPVLQESIFPPEILSAFQQYLKNPKASSCSDAMLYQSLHLFDTRQQDKIMLEKILPGELFVLNGRKFCRGEIRRTRVLCEEISSRKKYLVHTQALVEKI